MSNELATIQSTLSATPMLGDQDILDAWLSGRNAQTIDAYRRDWLDFARFVGAGMPGDAVATLLAMGNGPANRVALAYKAHLTGRELASATIARRIAALRSLVKLARQLGRIEWSLDIQSPRLTKYRDTSGPGRDGFLKLRARAKGLATDTAGKRDLALLALLHDSCLRRGECVSMDLEHVDLERSRVAVVGKGQTDRVWITISTQASDALAAWITARGSLAGPLFCRLDRAARGVGRITGHSINRLVGRLGRKADVKGHVRAHGLRHQGITRALDLTNGNIRMVQGLSRHLDPRVLLKYDDNRVDHAGKLAQMLGNDSDD